MVTRDYGNQIAEKCGIALTGNGDIDADAISFCCGRLRAVHKFTSRLCAKWILDEKLGTDESTIVEEVEALAQKVRAEYEGLYSKEIETMTQIGFRDARRFLTSE